MKAYEKGIINGKITFEPTAKIGAIFELVGEDMGDTASIIADGRIEVVSASKTTSDLDVA